MSKMKNEPLSEQIRDAVRASGLSMLEVARRAEIDKAALSRFLSGKVGLRLDALDRVAAVLGLRVVSDRRSKGSKQ